FYAATVIGGGDDSVNVPLNSGNTIGSYFHMFRVHAINAINLQEIGIRCHNSVNTMTSWSIYYRPDNYQTVPGANLSSTGWTLLTTVSNVPSMGANAYTTIASNLNLSIPANGQYSFHIAPGSGTTHRYNTSGLGTTVASNAD